MPRFEENILLANVSHYKIGGPARYFFEPKNENEIRWAVAEAKTRKLPMFIFGGGTNLLIADAGFKGLVLRPNIKGLHAKGDSIAVGAGVSVADLLAFSIKKSLSGLEWAGGLPGTVGGAIYGNAGCFGGEMKDIIVTVRSFDTQKMKVIERIAADCRFAYRSSNFKKANGKEIIISAALRMKNGDAKEIANAIQEKIDYREKNHPLDHPNVGSIFKNVSLAAIHKKGSARYEKALRDAAIMFRGSAFSVKMDPFPVISAAKLISESGLRGVSFGGAMISAKHPNFIVNVLNATSSEVKKLMKLARQKVHKKFGVQLEEEVQVI